MFKALGDFLSRHSLLVIVCWLVAAATIHLVAPSWNDVAKDGDLAYLPANMPSRLGEALLHDAFPDEKAKSSVALVVARHDRPLQSADLDWADRLSELCERETRDLPVLEIWNHNTEVVGEKLTSKPGKQQPGQATVVLLLVGNEFAQIDNIRLLKRIQDLVAKPKKPFLSPPGSKWESRDLRPWVAIFWPLPREHQEHRSDHNRAGSLHLAIGLSAHRCWWRLPLVTIGLSLFIATDVLALLTLVNQLPGCEWWNFKIFTTTKIFIVVILFGAGTDFCLFLISRFKEELDHGLQPRASRGRIGYAGRRSAGRQLP